MSESQSKGNVFRNLRKFSERRFGEAAWSDFLARCDPEPREIIRSALPIGWYPTTAIFHAFKVFATLDADPSSALLQEFGRYSAEADLTLLYRAFLRLADPAYVIEKAAEYWSRFHERGRWTTKRTEEGATGELAEFPSTVEFCAVNTAYIERMFELAGAKRVKCEHTRCRARGHATCVWTTRWR